MGRVTRLTSKGQVTIPKDVRDRLGLQPGDLIAFVEHGGTIRIEKRVRGSPFEPYYGMLTYLAGHNPDDLVNEMRGR